MMTALALATSLCAMPAHAKLFGKDAAPETSAKKGKPAIPESLPPITAGDPATAQVIVVLIYDKTCYGACQKVRPIIKELVEQHAGRVAYVELDAEPTSLKETEKVAKQWGVHSFLAESVDVVPVVGLHNGKRELKKEIQGPKGKDEYAAAIDKILAAK